MIETPEDIKGAVSLLGLFERDGHVLNKTGPDDWKCRCPFHEERSGSCIVHEAKAFFRCFGCGAKGDVFNYWALSRNLDVKRDFNTICDALRELIGGAALPPPRAERTIKAAGEIVRPAPLSGRDQEKWVEGCRFLALHSDEQERIAEWRGYQAKTVKELAEAGLMGLPRYFGNRLPGFAVEAVSAEGRRYLAGFHVRLEPKEGERPMWHFVPKGIGSWPFVMGEPSQCRALVILEGQWDAVAFVDALNDGLPEKDLAVMGIRGSSSWEKALHWTWVEDTTQIWLFADGDEAGMKWLEEHDGFASRLRRRSKTLHPMSWEGFKDFNEAHLAAVKHDREMWSADLHEMLRRQWKRGMRMRRFRPKANRAAS